MSSSVNILNPEKPKRIDLIAANAAISPTTKWQIGFWWAELTQPY